MNVKETKKSIIQAGQIAVNELIKVAKEPIVDNGDDISADRLKNAAATKKRRKKNNSSCVFQRGGVNELRANSIQGIKRRC